MAWIVTNTISKLPVQGCQLFLISSGASSQLTLDESIETTIIIANTIIAVVVVLLSSQMDSLTSSTTMTIRP
jgi:hypothetical protein